jgi:hypothetical protein
MASIMRRQVTPLGVFAVLSIAVVVLAAEPKRPGTKPIPSMSEIEQVVLRYFRVDPEYRAGDLITRDKVEPLLNRLKEKGLPLPDAKAILDKVLTKDHFLSKQFSTPNGRKFMRDISGYPDGYDRVDRLARLPHGEQTVRDLIRGPDGYKMIEYMTTAKGGSALGKQLSNAPLGKDFNAATGRIYTADQLLDRLKESRKASLKPAKR